MYNYFNSRGVVMRRKNKSIYIVLIVVALIGITIGYAAISRTLTITGNSEVRENTWDLHFENIKITNGSVEADAPTIDNTNLVVNFNFFLNLPGDFYEFTVEVHNDGSIDAMIDSITKTPILTAAQQKYMNYIIEYQNGEQIASKQLVKSNEFVRFKVRVEYRSDVQEADMPTTNETLNLGFAVNYVQADSSGIDVKDNGTEAKLVSANGDINEIGTIVTIGDQQFYTIGTEGDNVKLLSMYNLYVGNKVDKNWNVTALENPTGKQSELARGWIDGLTELYGITIFSSVEQSGTNYSDYVGSIVEGYVNAYKEILEGEEYGVPVVEARLITKDELESEDIGCDSSNHTCNDAPSWIYSTTYWTGSAYGADNVWYVDSFGYFNISRYDYGYGYGVRPVIIISKSLF